MPGLYSYYDFLLVPLRCLLKRGRRPPSLRSLLLWRSRSADAQRVIWTSLASTRWVAFPPGSSYERRIEKASQGWPSRSIWCSVPAQVAWMHALLGGAPWLTFLLLVRMYLLACQLSTSRDWSSVGTCLAAMWTYLPPWPLNFCDALVPCEEFSPGLGWVRGCISVAAWVFLLQPPHCVGQGGTFQ